MSLLRIYTQAGNLFPLAEESLTREFGAGSAGVEGRGCPEEEEKEGFGNADSILFLNLREELAGFILFLFF